MNDWCPNATREHGDGRCGGTRLIVHRGQPIPCPSCWQAAGNDPLTTWQTAALRAVALCLHELNQCVAADGQASIDASQWATALDGWSLEARRRGVGQPVRDAWLAWIARESEGATA